MAEDEAREAQPGRSTAEAVGKATTSRAKASAAQPEAAPGSRTAATASPPPSAAASRETGAPGPKSYVRKSPAAWLLGAAAVAAIVPFLLIPPSLWAGTPMRFAAVSLAFLSALLISSLWAVREHTTLHTLLTEGFPNEQLRAVHARLLPVPEEGLDDATPDDIDNWRRRQLDAATDIVGTIEDQLAMLEETLEQQWTTSSLLAPVRSVRVAAQLAGQDRDAVPQLLRDAHPGGEIPEPVRPFSQLFLNALLLVGIIGTFYGLIQVFSTNSITAFVTQLWRGTGAPLSEGLSPVFEGLQTAFASSLAAYSGYLCGRFMCDQVDDDHRTLAARLGHTLGVDLPNVFSPLQLGAQVAGVYSERVAAPANDDPLDLVVDQLRHIAGTFDSAVASLFSTITQLVEALEAGQKSWEAASEAWSTAIDNLETHVETFTTRTDTFAEIASNGATQIGRALARIDAAVEQAEANWRHSIADMTRHLQKGVDEYATTLNSFSAALAPQVESYQQLRTTIETMQDQVATDRRQLIQALDAVRQETDRLKHFVTSRLESTVEEHTRSNTAVAESLARVSQLVAATLASTERADRALGDGELLELLRRLHTLLADRDLPTSVAPPANGA